MKNPETTEESNELRNTDFNLLLAGSDLRSLRNNKKVIKSVNNQQDFERLFRLLFSNNRPVAMRASDAVEKITLDHPEYLCGHDKELLELARTTTNKELKWHLAQLVPRLDLPKEGLRSAWHRLLYWASNPYESKIVRANALEGLYELQRRKVDLTLSNVFDQTLLNMEHEHVPSLIARARIIRKRLNRDRVAAKRSRTD